MHMQPNNVVCFDSMADCAALVKSNPKRYVSRYLTSGQMSGDKWFSYGTAESVVQMLTTGDQSQVANAQALLDKFDVKIETAGMAMECGVAGFSPCVPEYLGGSPESMFCMNEVQGQSAPLKIIVDTVSSAGISQDVIQKRGTILLAMAMAMAAIRPITLEVVCMMDCDKARMFDKNSFSAVRVAINSAPLDLGSACYALCHSGFARGIGYGLVNGLFWTSNHDHPVNWPIVPGYSFTGSRDPRNISKAIELLGEDEANTLFIPAVYLNDPMFASPEKWISDVLAKYGQTELA